MNSRDERFPYRKQKRLSNPERRIAELLKFLHQSAVRKGGADIEEEKALTRDLITLRQTALFPQPIAKPNTNSLWHFMYDEPFAKLRKTITSLEANFDEMHERTQLLGIIKDLLHQLKNDLNPSIYKYERRLCLIIHDAIHKTKAERLTSAHLSVLSRAITTLCQGNCTKETYRQIDRLLRHHDLNWIIGDDVK